MRAVELLKELSEFSTGGPGTTRLAYSLEWRKAKELVIQEMKEIGLEVSEDAIGNIFGRLPGQDENLPPVGVGSHIDTVPQGGDYDGMVGVVAALEVARMFKEKGLAKHPLEVIVFAAEESSRFRMATMGSLALAGKADFPEWLKIEDKEGVTFQTALEECGYDPDQLSTVPRKKGDWKAFFEIHIEQGPVLERAKEDIGVVKAIAGATRMKIFVEGQADHSGATPMGERRDALVAAALIIEAIEKAAEDESHHGTVATVGNVIVSPGVMNVIPGLVELWVDLRGIDVDSIQRAFQTIKDDSGDICKERNCSARIEMISIATPVPLAPEMIDLLEQAAKEEGVRYRVMPSGAGHDAMYMAELAPTGMLFIPCKGGISHNPAEYTEPKQVMKGIQVLGRAVWKAANVG